MTFSSKVAKLAIGLLVATTFTFVPQAAFADTAEGFTFNVANGTSSIITGCDGACPADLVVPATLGGNPVIGIADWALSRANLNSVSLPEGLQTIGTAALAFNSLKSITLPSSVTFLDNQPFMGNPTLTSFIALGNAPTIGGGQFAGSDALAQVIVASTATGWGATFDGRTVVLSDFAFTTDTNNNVTVTGCLGSCPATLVIPSTINGDPVKSIAAYAFANQNLTSVGIASSVTSIGSAAFQVNRLATLTIPASVTAVGSFAFNSNPLTSVTFLGNAPQNADFVFFQNPLLSELTVTGASTGWGATWSGVNVTKISFTYTTDGSNNVTVTGCFGSCPANLVIPATLGGNPVRTIGDNAFEGAGINSVSFPEGLTGINYYAFHSNSIRDLKLPDSLVTLGPSAFNGNQLTSVVIPNGVTTIGWYAFSSNNISKVKLGESVSSIDSGAFAWSHIRHLIIPASVTYMAQGSFIGYDFESVLFMGNAPTDVAGAVGMPNTQLSEVTVLLGKSGWGATWGGYNVVVEDFFYNNSGNEITVSGCWHACPSKLIIPAQVGGLPITKIASGAFAAENLTSVVLPDSLVVVGDSAFRDNQLLFVFIPDSVTHIGPSAFRGSHVSFLTLGNSVKRIGGYAFESNEIYVLEMPNSLKIVGAHSFANNQLSAVTFGAGVTAIGSEAFSNNYLSSAAIPNTVKTIGTSAFRSNWLTSLTLPSTLSSVGNYAFYDNRLTSIDIPNSVTRIGDGAFRNNLLTSVTIPSSVTRIGTAAFRGNHLTSVDLGSGLTEIGVHAFSGNSITSVSIPDNVTKIGRYAFYNNQISSLTLGSSLEDIDAHAFRSNHITSVTLPESMRTIGAYAFRANGMRSMTYPSGVYHIGINIY